MTSRSKDIIFLLGAGASAEAGIPVSAEMINLVEKSLKPGPEQGLYNHVKSAIHFSAGLKGRFGNAVPFNIETLVNTLYALERNEEHPLYPFIASWSSRFVALAGPEFCNVRTFRQRILLDLKKWMCPEDSAKADYCAGFGNSNSGMSGRIVPQPAIKMAETRSNNGTTSTPESHSGFQSEGCLGRPEGRQDSVRVG